MVELIRQVLWWVTLVIASGVALALGVTLLALVLAAIGFAISAIVSLTTAGIRKVRGESPYG